MPQELKLMTCPNPHCNAETLPRYNCTGVDCMTQFNHIVSCECGVSVCGMSRKGVYTDWNAIHRAPTWTTEPPKVEGLFLRKMGGKIDAIIVDHPLIDILTPHSLVLWSDNKIPMPKESTND